MLKHLGQGCRQLFNRTVFVSLRLPRWVRRGAENKELFLKNCKTYVVVVTHVASRGFFREKSKTSDFLHGIHPFIGNVLPKWFLVSPATLPIKGLAFAAVAAIGAD